MTDAEIPSVTIEGGPNPEAMPGATPDSAMPGLLGKLPEHLRPYASLARWDRPVGIWLLLLPCWIGLAFTRIGMGWHTIDLWWAILFTIGAIAMRGAGCTWNDIQDQDLDAGVERTAARPIPSGQVTTRDAYLWLGTQLIVGFLVWLCLPFDAKIVALLAIPMVAAYPFMKRLTWWPQAWLGLTFNWGVLVAAATVSYVSVSTIILWLALAAWTVAYDTIYAMQDVEDDALIGVKSTARLFGDKAVVGAFTFHLIAAAIAGFATWAVGAGRIGALTMMAFLAHGVWQSLQLSRGRTSKALNIFKSNVWAGAILLVGLMLAAIIGGDRASTKVSTWNIITEEAKVEQEKLRMQSAVPGWMTPNGGSQTNPSRTGLFGILSAQTKPAPVAPPAPKALDILPDWMFSAPE